MRWAPFVLTAPIATACFSSSPSGPTQDAAGFDVPVAPESDAAMDATMEATADAPAAEVSAEAEAGFEASVEAAPVDAGADVPIDVPGEASGVPVTVTVVGLFGPESGVPIAWQDASGAPVSTSTTNAQGTATQVVSPGTMVTALMGSPSQPSLYTIAGIQPGDQLVVIDWASVGTPTTGPSVDLTSIPAAPAGAVSYALSAGPCAWNGFTATPLVMHLVGYSQVSCIGVGQLGGSYGAAYPALVEARDANGALLGFTFSKNNGFTTHDDAGNFDVSLGGGTWSTATTSQLVTVANQPDAGVSTWRAQYEEVADGVLLSLPTSTPADGGVLAPNQSLFTTHQGYPDFVQTELSVQPNTAGIDTLHAGSALVTRGTPPAADGNVAIDWTPLLGMPELIATTVDTTVIARPSVTWSTASGSLASVTGVITTAQWSGSVPEGGTQTGTWTIVAAGTAQTSVQAPAMPAALSAWAPNAQSSFQVSTVYAIQGMTALPTYAQLRAASSVFTLQTACIFYPMAPPLPAAGTLMMSGFTSGACP